MSAKPTIPTKLNDGKAIAAFPGFVDTWNWIVDFCSNLRGEGEEDQSKTLRVDRTTSDFPVIRGGGGGGGKEYICGPDSNITFTEVTDPSSPDFGKIKIDVYYV